MHRVNEAVLMIFLLVMIGHNAVCQEEEEMEFIAEGSISSDESNASNINETRGIGYFKKYNINSISASELGELLLLTPLQIQQFILYRKSFGDFISLMELQAVPDWDPNTIRKILPVLTLASEQPLAPELRQRIKEGEHRALFRTGGQINGVPTDTDTLDHQYKQLASYRFNFRDLLLWGITIEKDAGEKKLADHYSFFTSISKRGMLKNLVLGDYTVSMGQGLVHWQGFALGRSSNMMSVYRQGALFRAHTGTDENRFCRGVAIQLQKNAFEVAAFISKKNLDANTMSDTAKGTRWVSAFLFSGLHRTNSELEDRKSLGQFTAGGNIRFNNRLGKSSLNFVHTGFDLPIKKRDLPYNRFSISGSNWQNASIDHAVSTRMGFMFAELAIDKHFQRAMVIGLVKSIDPKLDVCMLYRNMGIRYRSLASNVFSESQEAGNEKGFFFNLNYMPSPMHRFEIYCDRFQQDWPTFSTPGKRTGSIYSFQYAWRPNKKTEFYTRIQFQNRTFKIRMHASMTPLNGFVLRLRNEMIRISKSDGKMENGQLAFAELIFKPPLQPVSASIRCSFFETDGYATRIYAYERDLPSYHVVLPHHGTGTKAYVVLQYKMGKFMQVCGKWSIEKNKNDWRVQAIWQWGA